MSKFLVDCTNPENYEIDADKRLHLMIIDVPGDVAVEQHIVIGSLRMVYIDGDVLKDYPVLVRFTVDLNDNWMEYYQTASRVNPELVAFYDEDDKFTVAIQQTLNEIASASGCAGVHWVYG